MELHHLALGARDVAELAAFYREVFALEELERYTYQDGRLRSIWLDMSGPILMIEHTDKASRSVRGVGSGPFLLAFEVSPESIDAFIETLEDHGIEIEDSTEYTSYFRDLEGNRVAVSHYPRGEQTSATDSRG